MLPGGFSVEHRGISYRVVEMGFPRGWKWTVGKGSTVTVGVCATRTDAIRQARTFIDAVTDWAV
jgi:GH24 family phage-related lysozyme (muramidase)